ncbi:hypothetical protein PTKIN_Ptkin06aG0068300 [Pterospermum kingtungense]
MEMRNKELHGEGKLDPVQASRFATRYMQESNSAQGRLMPSHSMEVSGWIPPDEDRLKVWGFTWGSGCNYQELHKGGNGCIVLSNPACYGCSGGEALAARKALEVARDMGFTCIDLEGDSTTIIKKLSATGQESSIVRLIIANVKRLASCFASCNFMHTRREGNNVAHVLAKFGVQQTDGLG